MCHIEVFILHIHWTYHIVCITSFCAAPLIVMGADAQIFCHKKRRFRQICTSFIYFCSISLKISLIEYNYSPFTGTLQKTLCFQYKNTWKCTNTPGDKISSDLILTGATENTSPGSYWTHLPNGCWVRVQDPLANDESKSMDRKVQDSGFVLSFFIHSLFTVFVPSLIFNLSLQNK